MVTEFPDAEVPAAVTASAAGRTVRLVWQNEAGGLLGQIDPTSAA